MANTATTEDLTALRRRIAALSAGAAHAGASATPRLPLGPAPIDAALGGGLALRALHEAAGPAARVFAAGLAGRAAALAGGPIVWIADRARESAIYPCGLKAVGVPAETLLYVTAPPREVAWAFEQALRSGAAGAVVAEATALPDFTRSRRLQLAARDGRALALLLAPDALASGGGTPRRAQASAAESRWLATPRPAAGPWAPPRFRLELLRNKKGSSGAWEVEWHDEAHRFRLAAPV